MKIECDKCGAKYSIADEKVRGKTFKIRCKKCSNVIIVRDKASAASAPEPAPAAAPGWHLAINGETVGPVTEQDVRERYQNGEIDRDTAVWQEGFEDWIPLGDVAKFSDLPARAVPPPVGGGDPFARAARDDYGGGGGLSAGFGGAAMGASEASPRVTNLTGQRNENSVLFSLDNLQALATGGASRSSASMSAGRLAPVTSSVGVGKPLATTAPTSEGSGLIDIRALGAAVGRDSGPAAAAAEAGGPPLDEALPSFGGSGFAGLAATPLVAQPAADGSEKRNSNVILIAMAGLVVLLLGAMAVFAYVLLTRQPEPVERVVIKEAPSVRDMAGAKDKDDDEDQDKDKDEAKDKDKNDAKEEGEEAKADPGSGSSSSSRRRSRSSSRSRGGGGSSSAKSDPTPTETPDPKPAASAGGGGGGGSDELDVDCILNPDLPKCGKGGTSKSTKKSAPTGASDPSLPEKLTASDIRDGVGSVKAAAKACGGQHGAAAGTSVKVRMSISGSSGRVVSAKAEPPHAGTALGNCVAGAVKKATFKKFRDAQMGVVYSFRM